jgi:FKBP-type peptidyl-prolyl cis-trans isomerases 1
MSTLNSLIWASFIIALASQAQAQPKFTKLPSGLEYVIVKDAPGSKKAIVGSKINFHIRTVLNDSTLFNSYQMNNNEPIFTEVSRPGFNGDVMEGLTLLTEGDSAIFRSPVDSIFKNATLPPFAKSGDKILFFVKMVSVKTADEYKKEQEELTSKQNKIDDDIINEYLKKNNIKATKTASGLYYVIHKPGHGENAKPGQDISMNYTGRLTDGTIFDSNTLEDFGHVTPFTFKLGSGQVIRGWDEGIALMNKGAKATLFIPSSMAYGSRAMPGNPKNPKGIPANSVLIFDVEMLDAK